MNLQDALVPDALWNRFEPLLPPPKRKIKTGRPRVSDRACLAGILYLLESGAPWRLVPCRELACGSPSTLWRRFHAWTEAGLWPELHQLLLAELAARGQIDLSRAILDAQSLRALLGGPAAALTRSTGPRPAANATSLSKPRACLWR